MISVSPQSTWFKKHAQLEKKKIRFDVSIFLSLFRQNYKRWENQLLNDHDLCSQRAHLKESSTLLISLKCVEMYSQISSMFGEQYNVTLSCLICSAFMCSVWSMGEGGCLWRIKNSGIGGPLRAIDSQMIIWSYLQDMSGVKHSEVRESGLQWPQCSASARRL